MTVSKKSRSNLVSDEIVKQLVQVNSVHEFLTIAINARYGGAHKVNVADFSRRAGFSSRSFLTEVLRDKKKLSRESASKIQSVLRLPRPCFDLLYFLVDEEAKYSPDQSLTTSPLPSSHDQLKALRKQVEDWWNEQDKKPELTKTFKHKESIQVFAALGSLGVGASLTTIQLRCGLPLEVIASSLSFLENAGVVAKQGSRYFAVKSQIDIEGSEEPLALAKLAKQACAEIAKKSESIAKSPNEYLFYSAFSVKSRRLPDLKEKLKERIFEVLNEYQDDDGDTVEQLFISLNL